MTKFFDPQDEELRKFYLEESFIADVQYEICRLMKEKDVSRAALARRLGLSAPLVTQMLGNKGSNLTLRTVAKIFAALGEKPALLCERGQATSERAAGIDEGPSWAAIAGHGKDAWSVDIRTAEAANDGGAVVWLETYRRRVA
jgi:transcriptional regulator with XRE-family HTH domain